MKKFLPGAVSRRLMAAVVAGTALSAVGSDAKAGPPAEAVTDISKYCQVCWRNARLHPDSWPDCTQEVLVRLLQTVEPDKWSTLLKQDENADRREFLRAIDAVKKRTQRARKYAGTVDTVADRRDTQALRLAEEREAVRLAAADLLSERQQRILQLSFEGWSVQEMADELALPAERVSDEKYKAIRKLRKELHA